MPMLALAILDADFYAVLAVVGFILAVVALVQSTGRSVLAWACVLVFFAIAWNAVAVAQW